MHRAPVRIHYPTRGNYGFIRRGSLRGDRRDQVPDGTIRDIDRFPLSKDRAGQCMPGCLSTARCVTPDSNQISTMLNSLANSWPRHFGHSSSGGRNVERSSVHHRSGKHFSRPVHVRETCVRRYARNIRINAERLGTFFTRTTKESAFPRCAAGRYTTPGGSRSSATYAPRPRPDTKPRPEPYRRRARAND